MFAKSTALAAAIAVSATSAFAGGLSPEIVETAVMEDAMVAPAGPSIDPSFIVLGVIAALLIATAVNDGDDDTPPPPPPPPPCGDTARCP